MNRILSQDELKALLSRKFPDERCDISSPEKSADQSKSTDWFLSANLVCGDASPEAEGAAVNSPGVKPGLRLSRNAKPRTSDKK